MSCEIKTEFRKIRSSNNFPDIRRGCAILTQQCSGEISTEMATTNSTKSSTRFKDLFQDGETFILLTEWLEMISDQAKLHLM